MRALDWRIMQKGVDGIISSCIALYGASSSGNKLIDYLKELGLTDLIKAVFDSNAEARGGGTWNGYEVLPPQKIGSLPEEVLIVISSIYVKEIFDYLESLGYRRNICSASCFRLAIHYDIEEGRADKYLSAEIIKDYKLKYDAWNKVLEASTEQRVEGACLNVQKIIAECPVSILIHGIPKTGNRTLLKSFREMKIANAIMTVHHVYHDEVSKNRLQETLRAFTNRDIRIITGIREPIECKISAIWQTVQLPFRQNDMCFDSIFNEAYVFSMEEWLKEQLEIPFGIDVFHYPFDKKKGYTIIKKDNISVFLYRLDFLGSLEKEISQFTGVKNFKLVCDNMATNKAYALAYQSFLEEVKFESGFLKKYLAVK